MPAVPFPSVGGAGACHRIVSPGPAGRPGRRPRCGQSRNPFLPFSGEPPTRTGTLPRLASRTSKPNLIRLTCGNNVTPDTLWSRA
ncbi:hypothetical protein B005_1319 [Nocardiopsis alba ATCC BAA-2165]|uniref:Uncharacterized protein n=1 Tax=Nocardiopsis alba (strain ATCC BAA-2165 / BE74) TaxID=1205910 RepID=J7L9L2_NOCAA|nr:hypothetical protein B005_1319 [Nocardiopsis alba ATCC BAA-2165]